MPHKGDPETPTVPVGTTIKSEVLNQLQFDHFEPPITPFLFVFPIRDNHENVSNDSKSVFVLDA